MNETFLFKAKLSTCAGESTCQNPGDKCCYLPDMEEYHIPWGIPLKQVGLLAEGATLSQYSWKNLAKISMFCYVTFLAGNISLKIFAKYFTV